MTEDRSQWSSFEWAQHRRETAFASIASKLKAWREEHHLSKYKVGLLLGAHHKMVENIEECRPAANACVFLAYCDLANIYCFDCSL